MTREEAKQWILEHMPPDDDTKQSQVMAVVIEALEQEPKTGRWKPNFRYGMYLGEEHFICSECNGQSMRQSKYCPECGAKMVEPQKSEEVGSLSNIDGTFIISAEEPVESEDKE